eukprot:gene2068-2003_t
MWPIIVMGVSGCGKTTVGKELAERLGRRFIDGDDLHPQGNRDKMSNGVPLTDADRIPWLKKIAAVLSSPDSPVIACSALRGVYRKILTNSGKTSVFFVHLFAPQHFIQQRLDLRKGHFFPAKLLASQYEILEHVSLDLEGIRSVVVRCFNADGTSRASHLMVEDAIRDYPLTEPRHEENTNLRQASKL